MIRLRNDPRRVHLDRVKKPHNKSPKWASPWNRKKAKKMMGKGKCRLKSAHQKMKRK
jgi:hypothetical protein